MSAGELRGMVGMLQGYVFGAHLVDWLVLGMAVSIVVFLWAKLQRS